MSNFEGVIFLRRLHILYNPAAGNNTGENAVSRIEERFKEEQIIKRDITKISDFARFAEELEADDRIMVCGGDGTLSRFANDIYDLNLQNEILYLATGSGNDFLRDIDGATADEPFRINEYIEKLPTVTVNGKTCRFINGVGFGVDGYCCEKGDEMRLKSDKPVDYTAIAVKGLLFHFKPADATVTVDGVSYEFKKVWIAPTMFGRFYGGGMLPAPEQRRDDPEQKVSLALFHGSGKLRTLMVFPSIFKGEHIKHTKMCKVMSAKEITVTFSHPTPLQIDGETVRNVTSYTVKSPAMMNDLATV